MFLKLQWYNQECCRNFALDYLKSWILQTGCSYNLLVLLLQCRPPALFFPKIKVNSIKISILTKNSRIPKFHFCIVAFAPHLPFTGLTFDSCNYCLRLPLALPACLPWLGLACPSTSQPSTGFPPRHWNNKQFSPLWFERFPRSLSNLISP